MDSNIATVRNRLRALGASNSITPAINGRVKSVDKGNYTCEVELGDGDSVVATLTCGDKAKGIIQIPKVNSDVIVVAFNRINAFVAMCDEVEQIIINGGELKGLVKIEDLKKSLNSIKDYCEALKSATSAGISGIGAGSSANGATGAGKFETEMASKTIAIEDMEDKIITH